MPTAEITLECKAGHRFVVSWPIERDAIQVPPYGGVDCDCPICGGHGKLVRAERGE